MGKIVRDFLYLDIERLYSLYSQVFEGVTDQIIKSYVDASSSSNSQKESLLKGGSVEAQVAEVSRRTENLFLYDHMYSLFEEKISREILDASEITVENFREALQRAFMLKVKGPTEVEDFDRFVQFTKSFNEIGEAIAYASLQGVELDTAAELVNGITDRNQRAKAKHLGSKQDRKSLAKQLAKHLGLHQDETALANLKMFVETFNPGEFDFTFVPASHGEELAFRGVIDRRWLRVQPVLLNALYGGYVENNWTMVGQPTYLPGDMLPEHTEAAEIDPNNERPSMRDPYRNVFRTSRTFDRMFLESKSRTEIVVCPIAIYRETELDI